MEFFLVLWLLIFVPIIAGLGFGITAITRGRAPVTRTHTLTGLPARLTGFAAIVLAFAYWWYVAGLWERLDP